MLAFIIVLHVFLRFDFYLIYLLVENRCVFTNVFLQCKVYSVRRANAIYLGVSFLAKIRKCCRLLIVELAH